MNFGEPTDFAIEAYHEPSGPEWRGFGRICIYIQGKQLGNVRENHSSLFQAVDRLRELQTSIEALWDQSFGAMSDAEIFTVLDRALYAGDRPDWNRYGRFDFLTNAGEPFDNFKTFIICRPSGSVHVLYQLPDGIMDFAACSVQSLRRVAASFVSWFDEQVRNTAPPYFPVEPSDR
ncbi:MAG: hypothetical protein QOI22_1214 [Verrucomicrobiota bacterium]|jgi:hypothetical protein